MKTRIVALAAVLLASAPALAADIIPFTGSFVPSDNPTGVLSNGGFTEVVADNAYGKPPGYLSQDGDNAYLLLSSNGPGDPPQLRTAVLTFTANTGPYKDVQLSGYWMPALAATLPGDSEYFFEGAPNADCVTIEAAHNGTGPSPIILVNNVCGAALNAANGQWAQFNTTPGQIPDDATEVRLIARLTSSAINERLGLDNLRIFGNVVQTAPTVSGIGLILLTLAMLVGGIFGVRRRFSPSHS